MLAVALLGVFSLANAQEEKKGRGARADALAAALAKADLSDDQKAKVKDINAEFAKASAAAREAKDREAMQKAGTERREAIMALLTDSQKEIVAKELAAGREKRGGGERKKKQEI